MTWFFERRNDYGEPSSTEQRCNSIRRQQQCCKEQLLSPQWSC
jgi:hypothetical protein